MPIKLDCPRCKNPLAVPSKKAGSYATCPRCQGRFWVPDDAQETFKEPEEPGVLAAGPSAPSSSRAAAPGSAAAAPSTSLAVPPGAAPPAGARVPGAALPATPKPVPLPAAPLPSVPAAPAPAVGPVALPAGAAPARKVARFITADAAQSSLKPAPDGKLPELKLGEAAEEASGKQPGSRGMHPLVLFALLAISVAASIVLVLVPTESAVPTKTLEREEARKIIETEYFRELDEDAPPRPYQLLLREAKLARARGDYRRERDVYRRVLDLLRAFPKPDKGITGSKDRDNQLERQLIILLSD